MENESKRGNKPYQKLKPYMILQYLLRESDENHVVNCKEIEAYLAEMKISSERRSIYRDIHEINLINLLLEEECSIETAEEMLKKDTDDELKLVLYDPHRKGHYIKQRKFEVDDLRILAECVYAAKFVNKGQADRLVDVVCGFASSHQAERIKHNAFLPDRVKTNNKSVLNSISVINDAMSRRLNGVSHKPEKISFKYLKYSIDDMSQQVSRRKGEKYTVSPYQLMINDGNYYLIAYVDEKKGMRTYRVDRMKEVSLTGEPREGDDLFRTIDIRSYAQRVFSMYGGRSRYVRVRFIPPLLDTMVERFGTGKAYYSKADDRHYTVETEVEISPQFYGWLLGLGKKAKLIGPPEEVKAFEEYVDGIRKMYE